VSDFIIFDILIIRDIPRYANRGRHSEVSQSIKYLPITKCHVLLYPMWPIDATTEV